MVNKHLTGASYGITSWLYQRITGLIMLISLIFLFIVIAYLASHVTPTIDSWQALFACVWIRIFSQIFFIALMLHAWVGIRDIWMDYVPATWLKISLHTLTLLWLVASFIYSIKVLWL